jgi:hypothetical protein
MDDGYCSSENQCERHLLLARRRHNAQASVRNNASQRQLCRHLANDYEQLSIRLAAVDKAMSCLASEDSTPRQLGESTNDPTLSPRGLGLDLDLHLSPQLYRNYSVAVRTFPPPMTSSSRDSQSVTRRKLSVAEQRMRLEAMTVSRMSLAGSDSGVPADWCVNYGKPVSSRRKSNAVCCCSRLMTSSG